MGASLIFIESLLSVSAMATETPLSAVVYPLSATCGVSAGLMATCMALPSVRMMATMAAALKSGRRRCVLHSFMLVGEEVLVG